MVTAMMGQESKRSRLGTVQHPSHITEPDPREETKLGLLDNGEGKKTMSSYAYDAICHVPKVTGNSYSAQSNNGYTITNREMVDSHWTTDAGLNTTMMSCNDDSSDDSDTEGN